MHTCMNCAGCVRWQPMIQLLYIKLKKCGLQTKKNLSTCGVHKLFFFLINFRALVYSVCILMAGARRSPSALLITIKSAISTMPFFIPYRMSVHVAASSQYMYMYVHTNVVIIHVCNSNINNFEFCNFQTQEVLEQVAFHVKPNRGIL